MSRLAPAGAPRFTHQEWVLSNNTNYATSEQQRALAERLRAEADRLIDETQEQTEQTQEETGKRLDQRVGDVKFWNESLDAEKTAVGKEIEDLLDQKRRIERALGGYLDRNKELTRRCLQLREGRKGVDLVHDEAQKELIKELEVMQGIEGLLQRTLEQVEEQVRACRSAGYYLQKDLADKFSSINTDGKCLNMTNENIMGHPGVGEKNKIAANSVTPEDWQRFSHDNIQASQRNRNASVNLRSIVDSVLEQTREDLEKQAANVDAALRRRIAETERAYDKLNEHHAKVLAECEEVESALARVQQATAEKAAPLAVAETRLNERTERPNVELCRDAPQFRLANEVNQIRENIHRLNMSESSLEAQAKQLRRTVLQLEEDIDVKKHTLEIDRELCVPERKKMEHPRF